MIYTWISFSWISETNVLVPSKLITITGFPKIDLVVYLPDVIPQEKLSYFCQP
uniref:Uncharacterized protein n=1 Tax=uncultured marine virus TaxID=186617 RepID=A0A0F7L9A6_9VIRU|nr:hypothetical protein [uncultured marine virus]